MTAASPIRFSLGLLFYATALIASAIATFGPFGILVAGVVMIFWCVVIHLMRTAVTLAEVVLAVLIVAIFITALLLAGSLSREAARRTQCLNNLRVIGLAISVTRRIMVIFHRRTLRTSFSRQTPYWLIAKNGESGIFATV